MAAPTFVSSSETSGDTTSLAIPAPASIVSGNLLVAFVYDFTNSSPGAPSGWTRYGGGGGASSDGYISTYTKTAGGSEPSFYTFTGNGHMAGVIHQYSGTAPYIRTAVYSEGSGPTSTQTSASLSALTNDVVIFALGDRGKQFNSTPSGYTRRDSGSGGLANQNYASFTKVVSSAGTEAPATTTPSADWWASTTVAVADTGPADVIVTVPPMTVAAAMLAPTVALAGGDVTVVVPPLTVAAAMLAPTVRMSARFAAYDLDANASQALNVSVDLYAVLEADVLPSTLPSHYTDPQVRARRLSLIMPTPTLDSRGRPT